MYNVYIYLYRYPLIYIYLYIKSTQSISKYQGFRGLKRTHSAGGRFWATPMRVQSLGDWTRCPSSGSAYPSEWGPFLVILSMNQPIS